MKRVHKALLITRHEFWVTLRRPSYLVFSLAIPVLATLGMAALYIYQAATQGKPQEQITAGVIDLTDARLFTSFKEQGTWTFELENDQAAAVQKLLNGDLDKLYVIPKDFLQTGLVVEIRRQQAGFGDLEGQSGNVNTTPLGKFILNNLFVGSVGPELAQRVLVPYSLATQQVDENGTPVQKAVDPGKLIFFMALAVLLVISVLTTSGYLLQGMNEEKENRIMEILLSSAKPEHLMLGKLFGLGSAGLLQMGVWITSGIIVLLALRSTGDLPESLSLSTSVPAILIGGLYFILGYFLFGTLMAALGAVTTSQREAGQVTFIVVLPGVVPMWFISQIISTPEGLLARILSFIPFSAPSASLVRLGVDGMGAIDLMVSLLILIAAVAGAMWLTIRLFRTYLLMYGQRPGLRQIFSTLRHA